MKYLCDLDRISLPVIQEIYRCLFQAIGEDYQEAEGRLGLETHISKPFLIWDLINRNLIRSFSESDVLYSTTKRGMWEILLLFDKESKMLLSFMKDTRFNDIQKSRRGHRPKYIQALLLLNQRLQAKVKQQKLFDITESRCEHEQLKALLDSLCFNFMEPVVGEIKHHGLVVFSSNYGQLSSLNAFVLDSDLDIVSKRDWLDIVKPIMSNEIEKASDDDENFKHKQPTLTQKAKQRLMKKDLVALKSKEEDKEEDKDNDDK